MQGFARIILGCFNVAIGFCQFDILDKVVAKFRGKRCCSETVWDCFFSVDLKKLIHFFGLLDFGRLRLSSCVYSVLDEIFYGQALSFEERGEFSIFVCFVE